MFYTTFIAYRCIFSKNFKQFGQAVDEIQAKTKGDIFAPPCRTYTEQITELLNKNKALMIRNLCCFLRNLSFLIKKV